MLYDAHLHNKNHENGGFLIGLEGEPYFKGTLNNQEVLVLHNPSEKYISFYYIRKKEIEDNLKEWPYLKYHPRREKYSPEQVVESISRRKPKAIIIDTLNEPYWVPYDYWYIAKKYSDIPFIFAHAGGYLINDFIKICHFQPNVWIDFALTHTTLGRLGDETNGLPYINQAIRYSLNSNFKNRVLMSSDYPFFDQNAVFNYYKGYEDLLNNNYIELINRII